MDKDTLTGQAHTVRVFEAACAIAFPSEFDIRFREAIERRLAADLNLPGVRNVTLPAPSPSVPRKP